MWISRGILLKVLLWNKAFLILLLASVSCFSSSAQETVFLQKGPFYGQGLEFLDFNYYGYTKGFYTLGSRSLAVYAVNSLIKPGPQDKSIKCSGLNLFYTDNYITVQLKDAQLFFILENEIINAENTAELCGFIRIFTDKFAYFNLRRTAGEKSFIFPAVLESGTKRK
jgi:hypothetical protein